MTIPLLELDDRRFDDLVQEFQALIPRYAEEWTNRNAADPGMMLVELFAWLTESQIYRINRVPKAVSLAFFAWFLAGQTEQPLADLATARQKVHQLYSHPTRLITQEDYETVIKAHFPQAVARVSCVPERNLAADNPTLTRQGHVSVMLVAKPNTQPFAQGTFWGKPPYYHRTLNPSGQRIALYNENQVLTWTATQANAVQALQLPPSETIAYCKISPDDGLIVVATRETKGHQTLYNVHYWRAGTPPQFVPVIIGSIEKPIKKIALAGQEGPLALQLADETIRLFWCTQEKTGSLFWESAKETFPAGRVYFHPGGRRMAIQLAPGYLQFWQLEDHWVSAAPDAELRSDLIVVEDTPHRHAALLRTNGELSLWDIWRHERLWTHQVTGQQHRLHFSNGGKRLVVRSRNRRQEFQEFAVASGAEVAAQRQLSHVPTKGKYRWKRLSNDKQRGVTIDQTKRILRVWHLARNEELAVFALPAKGTEQMHFADVFFAVDARHLVTTVIDDATQMCHLWIWPIAFDAIEQFVAANRQVGCRHHVIGARYVDFWVEGTVVVSIGGQEERLKQSILDRIAAFCDPRSGGTQGQGWPFARAVTLSELYQVIHGVPGVAYVSMLKLQHDETRQSAIIKAIELKPFELVNFRQDQSKLTAKVEAIA